MTREMYNETRASVVSAIHFGVGVDYAGRLSALSVHLLAASEFWHREPEYRSVVQAEIANLLADFA